MKNQPLVSIIMNCYNGEKYLREAIDSVISQKYNNWELIFWDNLSADKSSEIFKSYKDKRLKYYFAQSHSEILYKAKNYALEKVNGDFVAFLDVDDWWLPHKLEKQIPLFKDPKVGLVYGNLWRFFEKKNKKEIYRKKLLPKGMILNDLLDDYTISSATYVIRRESIKSLKYSFNDKFHIIGDFDLNIRLAAKWKFDCIQEPVAVGRIHGKNESLIKKNIEIKELKIWYEEMRKDEFFSNIKELDKVKKNFLYLEVFEIILNEGFNKSFLKVIKYPFCFKKIKLLLALILPRFILKKIKNY